MGGAAKENKKTILLSRRLVFREFPPSLREEMGYVEILDATATCWS